MDNVSVSIRIQGELLVDNREGINGYGVLHFVDFSIIEIKHNSHTFV